MGLLFPKQTSSFLDFITLFFFICCPKARFGAYYNKETVNITIWKKKIFICSGWGSSSFSRLCRKKFRAAVRHIVIKKNSLSTHKEMSKFLLPTKVQFTCLALQESRAMYVPNPEKWLISDILNSNLYFLDPKIYFCA